MGLKKEIAKLQDIAKLDPGRDDLAWMNLYLVEEVGEVATCIAVEHGLKNKNPKETTSQECVDVIISALGLFFASGGTMEQLEEYLPYKAKRWKKRVEKYRSKK